MFIWQYHTEYLLWYYFFLLWRCDSTLVMASSFLTFLDHTQRRTTIARTPLDEWSARHRDLYLTTHNTYIRQISTPPMGFEPTISAGERPQTYALDRAATGTGKTHTTLIDYILIFQSFDWLTAFHLEGWSVILHRASPQVVDRGTLSRYRGH